MAPTAQLRPRGCAASSHQPAELFLYIASPSPLLTPPCRAPHPEAVRLPPRELLRVPPPRPHRARPGGRANHGVRAARAGEPEPLLGAAARRASTTRATPLSGSSYSGRRRERTSAAARRMRKLGQMRRSLRFAARSSMRTPRGSQAVFVRSSREAVACARRAGMSFTPRVRRR